MTPRSTIDRESVLFSLRQKTSKPFSLKEISTSLGIPRDEQRSLRRILRSLIKSGDLYKTKSGFYGLAENMNLVTGVFEAHRDGYGFVIPEKSGERDLFIPPRKTMGSMSGDRVIARVERPERREGSIIKVLNRSQRRVVGQLIREKNLFFVKPLSRKIPMYILISPTSRGGAKAGNNVVAEITSYPTLASPPEGRVIKVLPDRTDPRLETELIIEEYGLPQKFPSAVISETRKIKESITSGKRVDCRDLLTITIDGETAKDFDDALSISRRDRGYVLCVHIADVSHYVPWDSALDLEARKRGTSVYFPGRVIPMLPEKLSNNLCSLVPGKDRLAFTVEMLFDRRGHLREKQFYPSIINSNERMTYTSVKKILVDKDGSERQKYSYLVASFELMEELCDILRGLRMQRGSLDFDLPEPEVLLDIQGNPEAIIRSERNLAHMIIEEFMIAANEAVASHLEKISVPSLYRVHEKPDTVKLDELIPVFNALGLKVKSSGPGLFASILKKTKGTAVEDILNILLLRSLKQAKYAEENIGHFGLASKCYTHFTSPIRRYPDLVIHRILKDTLKRGGMSAKKMKYLTSILSDIALQSSKTERTADEAEREVVNALRVWFMKDRVGDEFEGIVTGVSSKGLKVQLKDIYVEAFLNVSSLSDDYYRFDDKKYRLRGRRNRKSFTLGKELMVRIEGVDTDERQIILGLV